MSTFYLASKKYAPNRCMRALSNIQLLLVILRDNSIIILKLGCSTKEVIMSISARMIECPLCREKAQAVEDLSELRRVYTCPNCGRFEHYPLVASFDGFNMNHLSSYFAYNHYSDDDPRYFSTCSKEICAKRKQEFENCLSDIGYPVQLTAQDVENWYPKRFSEKIDFILHQISYISCINTCSYPTV